MFYLILSCIIRKPAPYEMLNYTAQLVYLSSIMDNIFEKRLYYTLEKNKVNDNSETPNA